ncbi:hypothetical protein JCM11641_000380 [Rhodosporidiobolus odoratus]
MPQSKTVDSTSSLLPTTCADERAGGATDEARRMKKAASVKKQDKSDSKKKKMGTFQLLGLTVAMGGAQLVSSVQGAYGTGFLLQLGVSTQATALVWLAGPVAGATVQPIVGALSDSNTGRYRRRSWIVGATVFISIALLYLVYADSFGDAFAPGNEEAGKTLGIVVGIGGIWAVQFGLNALQASTRDLVLDLAPSTQQNTANAWGARISDLASIIGYLAGYLDLTTWSFLNWVGAGQFRRLAYISVVVLVATVTWTCCSQKEKKGVEDPGGDGGLKGMCKELWGNIKALPPQTRRVCYVQFFAWMGLFPFLFYSSTYVSDVMASSEGGNPDGDTASRAGSLALLYYALIALLFASILPWLALLGNRPFIVSYLSSRPPTHFRKLVAKALAGLTLRNFWTFGLVAHAGIMAGTFWVKTRAGATWLIASMGVVWAVEGWVPYALVMESIRELEDPALPPEQDFSDPEWPAPEKGYSRPLSPFVSSSSELDSDVDLERQSLPRHELRSGSGKKDEKKKKKDTKKHKKPTVKEKEKQEEEDLDPGPVSLGGETVPPVFPHSLFSTALLHRSNVVGAASARHHSSASSAPSYHSLDPDSARPPSSTFPHSSPPPSNPKTQEAGGAILGIHNLAIVLPQMLMAGGSALCLKIFSALSDHASTQKQETNQATNQVVWMFRVGGVAALVGAMVSRWVEETESERVYRRRMLGRVGLKG